MELGDRLYGLKSVEKFGKEIASHYNGREFGPISKMPKKRNNEVLIAVIEGYKRKIGVDILNPKMWKDFRYWINPGFGGRLIPWQLYIAQKNKLRIINDPIYADGKIGAEN